MRALFGKVFGIGNAVMAVPAVKALATLYDVDVMVGTGPDDGGACEVFERLLGTHVRNVWRDRAPMDVVYDVAVMAMPFDGRWQEGRDYRAGRTLGGLSRPDPTTFGFSSWKKHEVLYQMDDVYSLGYTGDVMDTSFLMRQVRDPNRVYLGVGYKRDAAGYWKRKHWGNGRYSKFIDTVCVMDPTVYFVTTGDAKDAEESIGPIRAGLTIGRLVNQPAHGLRDAFTVVGSCGAYVGNDTGMMHVAASCDVPTFALFGLKGTTVKNHPFCHDYKVVQFDAESGTSPEPQAVAEAFVEWRKGTR